MMILSNNSQLFSVTNRFLAQKVLVTDRVFLDEFGCAVSIDGNNVLIGAENDNLNGLHSGSAFIYTHTGATWMPQQRLLASDEVKDYRFGHSVSLDNDTAIISAFGVGFVYVFTRNGIIWAQQAKLLASDSAGGFGCSVALSGDTALIGALGSVYVFIRSDRNWTQQAKLVPSDVGPNAFGWSVSLDEDTALIGAILDDDNGAGSGSAYVFTRTGTTWTQQAKLLASDGAADDYFGWSVCLDGDTALIGAYEDDDNGQNSGSAYVFTRSGPTWIQQTKLLASGDTLFEFFGQSVSLNGDTAIIGTYNFGSAYIFIRIGNDWIQQAKILTSEGSVGDDRNSFVSVDGDTAMVGAEGKVGRGAVYMFTRNGINWTQQAKLHALYNALLFGFITEKNDAEKYIKFKSTDALIIVDLRMFHIQLLKSGEQLAVSKQDKIGYIGPRFIIGMFEGTLLT